MQLVARLHDRVVIGRRARRLSSLIAELLPANATVLDVGSGSGFIAELIREHRPDIEIHGLDVLVRPDARIPVDQFDGRTIPRADGSVDCVLLVDVVHHAADGGRLLAEAARVSRTAVIVKDHCADGLLAVSTLRFMDRVGNRRFGVALPYNYFRRAEWNELIARCGLVVRSWNGALRLYPAPARPFFERSLHFVARLEHPVVR